MALTGPEALTHLCTFCGTVIEPQAFEIFGRVVYRPNQCYCPPAIEARNKAETEERRERLKGQLERLLTRAGLGSPIGTEPNRLAKYKMQTWNGSQYPKADVYQQVVLEFTAKASFGQDNLLFIHGPYGVGKTHLAVAALRKMMIDHVVDEIPWRGHYCDWTSTCSMVQESWENQGEKSESKLWGAMRGAHILVLDDIDKKKATEWALGKLFEVIQHRYNHEKPTIITANHSIKELQTLWGKAREEHIRDLGRAILSRFMEQLWRQLDIQADDQRDK